MTWMRRHFLRHLDRQPWAFCWRIGVESTVVSLLAATVLVTLLGTNERGFMDHSMAEVFCLLLLVAPPIETLLLQAIPVFFVRILKGSLRIQVLVSAIVFAAVHFPEGIAVGVSAGIIGGFYFGLAYAHWRKKSRWQSFWITTLIHAIHNGIGFLLLLIFGNWA